MEIQSGPFPSVLSHAFDLSTRFWRRTRVWLFFWVFEPNANSRGCVSDDLTDDFDGFLPMEGHESQRDFLTWGKRFLGFD